MAISRVRYTVCPHCGSVFAKSPLRKWLDDPPLRIIGEVGCPDCGKEIDVAGIAYGCYDLPRIEWESFEPPYEL